MTSKSCILCDFYSTGSILLRAVRGRQLRTARSPEMLAPARMPVAAGKKMAKTEKKVFCSRKSGPMFSHMIEPDRKTEREFEKQKQLIKHSANKIKANLS